MTDNWPQQREEMKERLKAVRSSPCEHVWEYIDACLARIDALERELEIPPTISEATLSVYTKIGAYYVGRDMANEECQQHIAELERENARTRRFAKFIADHDCEFYGDWACERCHPNSDILVAGFTCAYHEAMDISK